MPRARSLGFQSKLLIMLLTVSVISVLIAGAIWYVSGTNSLRHDEYQRLTQLRESRAREITAYYRSRPYSAISAARRADDSGSTDLLKQNTARQGRHFRRRRRWGSPFGHGRASHWPCGTQQLGRRHLVCENDRNSVHSGWDL
jgi:hypothetical protein